MIELSKVKKLLVLAPHPDDAEFSSGGIISKLIENGTTIYYAVFSMCEKSIPEGFPPKTIEKELDKAAAFLGLKSENVIKFDYEVREFPKYRQEILEDMVLLNKRIQPDLVLLPTKDDMHQDHKTVHEEGVRAFKYCNLLGYEMPWNNFSFDASLYVVLEPRHIKNKIDAINLYESQKGRNYSSSDFVESLAKLRGIQVTHKYAESFEIIRWIIH